MESNEVSIQSSSLGNYKSAVDGATLVFEKATGSNKRCPVVSAPLGIIRKWYFIVVKFLRYYSPY